MSRKEGRKGGKILRNEGTNEGHYGRKAIKEGRKEGSSVEVWEEGRK